MRSDICSFDSLSSVVMCLCLLSTVGYLRASCKHILDTQNLLQASKVVVQVKQYIPVRAALTSFTKECL